LAVYSKLHSRKIILETSLKNITINSRTSGMLTAHTGDISESRIATMLPIEAPLAENKAIDGFSLSIYRLLSEQMWSPCITRG
jgi:hypothetical protein